MPAGFQRYLPIVLVAVVALFVLPAVFKKHSSGPSSKTKATQTFEAMDLVDRGEQSYKAAHGRFTAHIADLLQSKPRLANDLAVVTVALDVSTDGSTVLARVASDYVSLVRVRTHEKIVASSCLILKSGSGAKCPAAAA